MCHAIKSDVPFESMQVALQSKPAESMMTMMTVDVPSHLIMPKNLSNEDGDGSREKMIIKTIHLYPDTNPPT
jgi:hypothetical protein